PGQPRGVQQSVADGDELGRLGRQIVGNTLGRLEFGTADARSRFSHVVRPSRNGFSRRSAPIVVDSPCPGSTTVSSSSTNSLLTIEPSRSRPLPPPRSVRPTDCLNKVSPLNTTSSGPSA